MVFEEERETEENIWRRKISFFWRRNMERKGRKILDKKYFVCGRKERIKRKRRRFPCGSPLRILRWLDFNDASLRLAGLDE